MIVIKEIEQIYEKDIYLYGNKTRNLWIMKKKGVNIPYTLAILSPRAWDKKMSKEDVLQQIDNYTRQYFNFTEDLIVRSSFSEEDSSESSLAGRFKSIQIESFEQIKDAVCQVWDSAGIKWNQMGVIIQQFIKCDFSGIMFSESPYGKGSDVMIEFANASCSHLVKGDITPDLYIVNKGWIRLKPEYVSKRIISKLICLENEIRLLMGTKIDIEFCVKEKNIFVLQCRPITTGEKKD